MKKNKGFTLIELLAVIVILAIIAVIATPIIMGIIDDSRVASAKASANGAVEAVKSYYAKLLITATPIDGTLTVDFSNPNPAPTGVVKGTDIPMQGTRPSKGIVTLGTDGKITVTGDGSTKVLTTSDYKCTWDEAKQEFTSCNK